MATLSGLESRRKLVDAGMEKIVPRKLTRKDFESAAGRQQYGYSVLAEATESVNLPVWDLLERGGKRWRPALMLLVAEAFGADSRKLLGASIVPEIVHNGTLMVDDVEDDSEMRRGKQCIHKTYGVDVAVNAGSAMYFLPLTAFSALRGSFPDSTVLDAYEIFAEEMRAVSYGQGVDILWHKGKGSQVSEEKYLQMVALKTGALARMSARLGALFAGADGASIRRAGEFAEAVGVAFQIQDDILNLTAGTAYGKEIGGDISEGKRTLITAHAMKAAPVADRNRLQAILSERTKDPAKIREAIGIVKSTGSVEYAKVRARDIVAKAWAGFSKELKESRAKAELAELADYLVDREV